MDFSDERIRFSLLLAGGILVMLAAGLCIWGALQWEDERPSPSEPKKKVFRTTLAEGLRISKDGFPGIEFVKCGKCRLEKRKHGVLTFGGMNVLVLENLDVIVPPDEPCDEKRKGSSPDDENPKAVVRRLGVSNEFLSARGLPVRFSGVRIERLSVCRLEGSNTVVRVFTARRAEAKRGGLELSGCRIARGDGAEPVDHARLKLEGRALRLVWKGGEMDVRTSCTP